MITWQETAARGQRLADQQQAPDRPQLMYESAAALGCGGTGPCSSLEVCVWTEQVRFAHGVEDMVAWCWWPGDLAGHPDNPQCPWGLCQGAKYLPAASSGCCPSQFVWPLLIFCQTSSSFPFSSSFSSSSCSQELLSGPICTLQHSGHPWRWRCKAARCSGQSQ